MDRVSIRISRSTHDLLRELSSGSAETMCRIVDEAVRDDRARHFWADYHAAYAALRTDPIAWAEFRHEIEAGDTTLADGLKAQGDDGDTER